MTNLLKHLHTDRDFLDYCVTSKNNQSTGLGSKNIVFMYFYENSTLICLVLVSSTLFQQYFSHIYQRPVDIFVNSALQHFLTSTNNSLQL